jgi:hypothetical protein
MSVVTENISQKILPARQPGDLVAHLRHPDQRRGRELPGLLAPARCHLEELQHVGEALARVIVGRVRFLRLGHDLAQHGQRRVGFAFSAFVDDDAEHVPDVFHRFKVIAAIAEEVDDADDLPPLELAQAVAHVGSCHAERRGNLLGMERPGREEQQRVDLGDGAVDPPSARPFPPSGR